MADLFPGDRRRRRRRAPALLGVSDNGRARRTLRANGGAARFVALRQPAASGRSSAEAIVGFQPPREAIAGSERSKEATSARDLARARRTGR
jgi:hypothetical protein